MSEWDEITNKLKPVTWDEIKEFYKRNFNETLSEDWKEAFCFAWSKSRKMAVIDLLATGYRAAKNSPEKQDTCEHILDMEKMVDVNPSSEWISVKDRLPSPETEVLWWNKAAHQAGVSSWEYRSYCDDTMIYWGDAGNVSIKNFTHWMPLPKPPEEK
jgi:hypothetical protein